MENRNPAEPGPAVLSLMKPGAVTVEASCSILDVAKTMKQEGVRNVFVVRDGKPVGYVRDIDIVTHVVALRLDPAIIKAEQLSSTPAPMVTLQASFAEIADIMHRTEARRILVTDGEKILGTITAGDLLGLVSQIPPGRLQPLYKKLQQEHH